MIRVKNTDIIIKNKILLRDVNLEINKGQIVRLLAPNGGGKTTLMEAILGLNNYYKGSIERSFKHDDYGYLPQVAHQYPKMHLLLGDICEQEYSFYPMHLKDKTWSSSSGGERKKALLAKAFNEARDLLILDEPFNHLDERSTELVSEELFKQNKNGLTIIYSSHDIEIPATINMDVLKWKS